MWITVAARPGAFCAIAAPLLKTLPHATLPFGTPGLRRLPCAPLRHLHIDRCDDLTLTGDVNWTSMGGTSPSTIYAKYRDLPIVPGFPTVTSFTLLTDGQVPSSEVRTRPTLARMRPFMVQVERMASHVDKTSHLPTVLGIAAVEVEAHHLVSRYNVSVLFAHFTAARSAILVVSSALVWLSTSSTQVPHQNATAEPPTPTIYHSITYRINSTE